jgi:hypothetical protein
MTRNVLLLASLTAVCHAIPQIPAVELKNSAVPGLMFPATGLGTGGYNSNPNVGYGGYPE